MCLEEESMPTVTVYSLPEDQCRACWGNSKWLTSKGIPFEKVYINEDEEAYRYVTEELGFRSAPVVVVRDGDRIIDKWDGFMVTKIEALAKRLAA
mgnify:CR=1 FL=1